MDDDFEAFETAALAVADGVADDEQVALLEGDQRRWRRALERLLDETEDHLDVVWDLKGEERDQVVADFEGLLDRLEASYDRLLRILEPERFLRPPPSANGGAPAPSAPPVPLEPEEVRLQASWAIVVMMQRIVGIVTCMAAPSVPRVATRPIHPFST